ncbi:MAG: OmpA family protein [Negativicutes bacterium]|nr:OmpA family protein [Negativicutes bacterium]
MARKKKHHNAHHEEHADETWLIPYSDLLTLLLALFIVLFASSNVDQKKFQQIASAFSMVFANSASIFESPKTNPSYQEMSTVPPKKEDAQAFSIAGMEEHKANSFLAETAQLMEVKQRIDAYIQANKLGGDLSTALTQDGLLVRINDSALFDSGSAAMLPQSERFAKEIAKLLAVLNQRVVISGHTDNVPINTSEFPSNWELSAKRAINFMKYILASDIRLRPERFSAIGHGEYRPLAPNTTPEGRQKNRRVEILIQRNFRQ